MVNPLAVRKLMELKKAILADARVDWTETLVVSDFIEKACEDGVIEPEESSEIAAELDRATRRRLVGADASGRQSDPRRP